MGKNASNERIKLKATFHNNVSVAMLVAGFAVPYLALFPKIPQIGAFLENARQVRMISITQSELSYVVCVVVALAMAFWVSKHHRAVADKEIQKLTD